MNIKELPNYFYRGLPHSIVFFDDNTSNKVENSKTETKVEEPKTEIKKEDPQAQNNGNSSEQKAETNAQNNNPQNSQVGGSTDSQTNSTEEPKTENNAQNNNPQGSQVEDPSKKSLTRQVSERFEGAKNILTGGGNWEENEATGTAKAIIQNEKNNDKVEVLNQEGYKENKKNWNQVIKDVEKAKKGRGLQTYATMGGAALGAIANYRQALKRWEYECQRAAAEGRPMPKKPSLAGSMAAGAIGGAATGFVAGGIGKHIGPLKAVDQGIRSVDSKVKMAGAQFKHNKTTGGRNIVEAVSEYKNLNENARRDIYNQKTIEHVAKVVNHMGNTGGHLPENQKKWLLDSVNTEKGLASIRAVMPKYKNSTPEEIYAELQKIKTTPSSNFSIAIAVPLNEPYIPVAERRILDNNPETRKYKRRLVKGMLIGGGIGAVGGAIGGAVLGPHRGLGRGMGAAIGATYGAMGGLALGTLPAVLKGKDKRIQNLYYKKLDEGMSPEDALEWVEANAVTFSNVVYIAKCFSIMNSIKDNALQQVEDYKEFYDFYLYKMDDEPMDIYTFLRTCLDYPEFVGYIKEAMQRFYEEELITFSDIEDISEVKKEIKEYKELYKQYKKTCGTVSDEQDFIERCIFYPSYSMYIQRKIKRTYLIKLGLKSFDAINATSLPQNVKVNGQTIDTTQEGLPDAKDAETMQNQNDLNNKEQDAKNRQQQLEQQQREQEKQQQIENSKAQYSKAQNAKMAAKLNKLSKEKANLSKNLGRNISDMNPSQVAQEKQKLTDLNLKMQRVRNDTKNKIDNFKGTTSNKQFSYLMMRGL